MTERLIAALSSDDPVSAARQLSTMRGLRTHLLAALEHEKRAENRCAIVYALAWQDDVRAWWPLMRLAADVNEHESVRDFACEGLAYLFPKKRRTTLGHRAALHLFTELAHSSSHVLRVAAVFALSESRDPAAATVLRALRDDARLAAEARRALEHLQRTTSRRRRAHP